MEESTVLHVAARAKMALGGKLFLFPLFLSLEELFLSEQLGGM